jgi:hypothetical protein
VRNRISTAVETLPLRLQTRPDEYFIPQIVKKLRTDLVQDGEMTMQIYFRAPKEFYDTALSYLEPWNKHSEDLLKLNCLRLEVEVHLWSFP